jgi:hypothetical protein
LERIKLNFNPQYNCCTNDDFSQQVLPSLINEIKEIIKFTA